MEDAGHGWLWFDVDEWAEAHDGACEAEVLEVGDDGLDVLVGLRRLLVEQFLAGADDAGSQFGLEERLRVGVLRAYAFPRYFGGSTCVRRRGRW